MIPPRLARALVIRAVPRDSAGLSIVGDLDAEFLERSAQRGARMARVWYWRQALSVWCWSLFRHPRNSHHQPEGALVDIVGDIRQSLRNARRSPGETVLISSTLALGIGATTIGFAFADTVFLRGMPIADPGRTVIVYSVDPAEPSRRLGVYAADVLAFRERAQTIEDLSTWAQTAATMKRPGSDPARVTVSRVSGDLFGVWGLRTQLGRGLQPRDYRPGAPAVATLSDRFWREAFKANPQVIGQSVFLGDSPHAIVGVMTPEIEFATFANIDLWISAPLVHASRRDLTPLAATGRLVNGATVDDASAELAALARVLSTEFPKTNRNRQALVLTASRAMGGPNILVVMTLLVGVATLITVIAAVNVAGVLLARTATRQREIALRIALGAGKMRVVRQLLTEGLLLAALGGIAGIAIAEGGLHVIRSVGAELIFQQIAVDTHELLFAAALALITPLVFTLTPAMASLRIDLIGSLNAASPRMSLGSRHLRNGPVGSQIALAVALAVIGGLVARSAVALLAAPVGFETNGLITFQLLLEGDEAERRRGLQATLERLAQELGANAGAFSVLPALGTEIGTPVSFDRTRQDPDRAHVVFVSASALNTLGVPIIAGRDLSATDIDGAGVVLISDSAAVRHFGSASEALDRELTVHEGTAERTYRIVGVTLDVRDVSPESGMPSRVWVPLSDPKQVAVAVRTSLTPAVAAETTRRTVRRTLPNVPVEELMTFNEAFERRTSGDRVLMGMLIAFAIIAVFFAVIGLYGTVALAARLRRSEFATRLALGAQVGDVASLVVRDALRLSALGAGPGVLLGIAAGMGMRGLLYGVTPLDPLILLMVAGLVVLVSVIASLVPAIRSARLGDQGSGIRD